MEFSCSTFGRFGARSTGSCYSNEFISMQWTAELDPWWGVYPWQGRRKWGGRWGNRTPTFPFRPEKKKNLFLEKDLDYFKLPISSDLPTALHDEGCCAHLAVLEGKGWRNNSPLNARDKHAKYIELLLRSTMYKNRLDIALCREEILQGCFEGLEISHSTLWEQCCLYPV